MFVTCFVNFGEILETLSMKILENHAHAVYWFPSKILTFFRTFLSPLLKDTMCKKRRIK